MTQPHEWYVEVVGYDSTGTCAQDYRTVIAETKDAACAEAVAVCINVDGWLAADALEATPQDEDYDEGAGGVP